MKKNITINLFGTLYQIDEDAYELLEKYQNNMRSYYSHKEGGEEIADDVEHRVAELFAELRSTGVEAITIEHIQEIIHRIGDPQQMDSKDEEEAEEKATGNAKQAFSTAEGTSGKGYRKLYRDPEDKILGGVISGITHFFGGSDPLPWRIVFLVLCLATTFSLAIVYFICWLLIPTAETAEERLKMYGKPVNPQAINEELMRGVNKTKEGASHPENKAKADGCLSVFLKIVVYSAGAIMLFIFGSILLAVLISIVVALFATAFGFGSTLWMDSDIDPVVIDFIGTIPHWAIWVFITSVIFVLALPIYVLIHALFRKKGTHFSTFSKTSLFILWLVALAVGFALFVLGVKHIEKISEKYDSENHTVYVEKNTRNGLFLSNESWDYLNRQGWSIAQLENCESSLVGGKNNPLNDEYESCLQFRGKDGKSALLKYTLNKESIVKSGKYRIDAWVYADGQGNSLFVTLPGNVQSFIADVPRHTHSNLKELNWEKAQKIPFFATVRDSIEWKMIQARADENDWDYLYLDFDIDKEGTIKYGFTNDPKYNTNPWTSTEVNCMGITLTRLETATETKNNNK